MADDNGSSVDKYDVHSDLPSLDWELNLVLVEIADEIEPDDLERLKFLCSGEAGFPSSILENITTCLKFFESLRRNCLLDRYNLLFLQAMLWRLGKKKRGLYKKLSDFARRCETEPLNFFTTEEITMPDVVHVHFHVSGTDTSKRDISNLQLLVSKLTGAPYHTIHVCGVKPYRSIIITFRIHVDFVEALKQLTAAEKGLLRAEGIDSFFMDEEEFRIAEEKADIPARLSERDEVVKLMNRNRKMEKEVEKHLLEISVKEKTVDGLKDDLKQINDTLRDMLTIVMDARTLQSPIDFDKENILRQKISEFNGKYPRCSREMHEILILKGMVVQQSEKSECSNNINTMVTSCEILYRRLHSDLYGTFTHDHSNADSQNEGFQSVPSTPDRASSGEAEVLQELSMSLHDEHKTALRGDLVFSDKEEQFLRSSPQHFLRTLFEKEPLPAGKNKRQYLIDRLQASGMDDLDYVTNCFEAVASANMADKDDTVNPVSVNLPVVSTPKSGQITLHRSMSDVFPKSSTTVHDADNVYMTLIAFKDILPELLKQLPATDSLKRKTGSMIMKQY